MHCFKAEEEPDGGSDGCFNLEEMMGADAEVVFNARREFRPKSFPHLPTPLQPLMSGQPRKQVTIKYDSHGFRGALQPQLASWRGTRTSGWLFAARRSQRRTRVGTEWLSSEARSVSGTDQDFFHRDETGTICFSPKQHGEKRVPLLLLDDIFDKLDAERVARIVEYVGGEDFGQISLPTPTAATSISSWHIQNLDYRLFYVENGTVGPHE